MPNRLLFIAALIAGASFYFHDAVSVPLAVDLAWKASGCALLAAWAATQARSADGWLLAGAFALYATADVVIDLAGLVGGAVVFIAGHLAMILIYLRHRRATTSEAWVVAALLLVAVPLAAFLLPERRSDGLQVALYATVLGAMATTALLSQFRRDRVLLGALLFVASDLLIFSRLGPLAGSQIPDIGIWPLYFAGQALVAAGVAQALQGRGR